MPSKTIWIRESVFKEIDNIKGKSKRSISSIANELMTLGIEYLHKKRK